jgi:hypothetical protein
MTTSPALRSCKKGHGLSRLWFHLPSILCQIEKTVYRYTFFFLIGKYVKEAFDNVNGKQKNHPELATISWFVKVI